MKKNYFLVVFLLALFYNAQQNSTKTAESNLPHDEQITVNSNRNSYSENGNDSLAQDLPSRYLTVNLYGGYDFPSLKNNLSYFNSKPGFLLGASVSYYWGFFGLGADVDYITNKVENLYPVENLYFENMPLGFVDLKSNAIKRTAITIGPSLKFQNKNHRLNLELFARGGVANIIGGNITLRAGSDQMLLFDYKGLNSSSALTAKGGARINFYFTKNFGLNIGGYFMKHFKVNDIVENGYSAYYRAFDAASSSSNQVMNTYNIRKDACNCDMDSYGITAGLSLRFGSKNEPDNKLNGANLFSKMKEENIETPLKKTFAITAVDKISKEKLPYADVAIVNSKGEIVKTGTTNHFGAVVFEDLPVDSYTINSKLYNEDLEGVTIDKDEFAGNNSIQKIVYYTKKDLFVKGKVLDCKTKKPLSNANIYAENANIAFNKTSVTDENGNFVMKLESGELYKIFATKSLYFSEIKEYTATTNDRNISPIFNLELCAENADCGNSIKLNKIYYDFNKSTLRAEAYPELEKLLRFLIDNPTAKVELSSHTDARGSDNYNNKLSEGRAKSVVDYLVSSGISRTRLIPIGKGETQILNHCKNGIKCTDDEHLFNRRTEMRVICIDNK